MQVMHMYLIIVEYCLGSEFKLKLWRGRTHSSGVANLEGKEERVKIGFDTTIVVRMSVYVDAVVVQKQQYQQDGCFHDKLSQLVTLLVLLCNFMS
jgi:hypothetical protein